MKIRSVGAEVFRVDEQTRRSQ